jgi:hypothetical protein
MNTTNLETEVSPADIKRVPIRKRIVTAQAVVVALAKARQENAVFKSKMAELRDMLDPAPKIKALEAIISQESDPDVISDARRTITELKSSPETVRTRARTLANQAYRVLLGHFRDLVSVALVEIRDLEIEAEVAETALFAGFGMEREDTAVSRRVRQHAADLRSMLENLQIPKYRSAPSANGGDFLLNWFKA